MTVTAGLELTLFFLVLGGLTPPLGHYLAQVLRGGRLKYLSQLWRLERLIYRVCGIDPLRAMDWKEYCWCLLSFNAIGLVFVMLLLMLQQHFPLNPQHLAGMPFHLAFNTAVSFVTNTNWQAYSGETTLGYLAQFLGLTVQNFLSAATGIAAMAAVARGILARQSSAMGNFWADLVRSTLYVLLPLSVIVAIALVSQGMLQNLSPYVTYKTVEGDDQTLPMGPVASQIAIKQLGTNGGGYFGVNSSHPFENPTPASNFIEVVAILLIPAACAYAYGLLVNNRRHGLAILGVMVILFVFNLTFALWSELKQNPVLGGLPFLEGKETRFGIVPSVLWGMATTVASNGSVNSMHSSFSPLTGGVAMFNMMLGEVVFGGVGTGIYTMVLHVLLTVFIAGLMVGRTPEYLGKKVETRDVILAVIGVLLPSVCVLLFSVLSLLLPVGLASLSHQGPHGLSEVLYAFTSASNNNGSAFAGLNANTPYYNLLTGLAMLVGRYGVVIPALALAGGLGRKKYTPPSAGTFPTDSYLFMILLIGVIVIVGALTFFPALSLGPIIEHFLMLQGRGI